MLTVVNNVVGGAAITSNTINVVVAHSN